MVAYCVNELDTGESKSDWAWATGTISITWQGGGTPTPAYFLIEYNADVSGQVYANIDASAEGNAGFSGTEDWFGSYNKAEGPNNDYGSTDSSTGYDFYNEEWWTFDDEPFEYTGWQWAYSGSGCDISGQVQYLYYVTGNSNFYFSVWADYDLSASSTIPNSSADANCQAQMSVSCSPVE